MEPNKKKDQPKKVVRKRDISKIIKKVVRRKEGRDFVRWLEEQCGFLKPSTVLDPNTSEIRTGPMIHNEALRGLFLIIRREIPKSVLVTLMEETEEKEINNA